MNYSIYPKLLDGDHLTDEELEYSIAEFKKGAEFLQMMGPSFRLPFSEVSHWLCQMTMFAGARGLTLRTEAGTSSTVTELERDFAIVLDKIDCDQAYNKMAIEMRMKHDLYGSDAKPHLKDI